MFLRVCQYIQRQGFSVYEMAELAPGVIVVHDDYGSLGEFDAYIDDEAVGPAQPEIWGEEGLTTFSLKQFGLGVLQGASFTYCPKSIDEFFQAVPQLLVGKQVPIEWYEAPKLLEVPKEIQVATN